MIGAARAREILEAMRGRRLLVVGDLMLDRYVWGTVTRISPEAPVPVVHVTREEGVPGGAANVALNLQSLGGTAMVGGATGADAEGGELIEALRRRGIDVGGIVAVPGLHTTVKTRIVAERQQVVRYDREERPARVAACEGDLRARLDPLLETVDGVVIEDYGKGVLQPALVAWLLERCRARRIPVGYDPRQGFELPVKGGLALATPNFREACWAAGLPWEEPLEDPAGDARLEQAGDELARRWDADLLLITLGAHGIYMQPRGGAPRRIPTRAREVFDVSGAGDTVIAAALAALTAGATQEEAVHLANAAAGVVVAKVGTASCEPGELLAALEEAPE